MFQWKLKTLQKWLTIAVIVFIVLNVAVRNFQVRYYHFSMSEISQFNSPAPAKWREEKGRESINDARNFLVAVLPRWAGHTSWGQLSRRWLEFVRWGRVRKLRRKNSSGNALCAILPDALHSCPSCQQKHIYRICQFKCWRTCSCDFIWRINLMDIFSAEISIVHVHQGFFILPRLDKGQWRKVWGQWGQLATLIFCFPCILSEVPSDVDFSCD